ncbi:MAG: hypothetical protein N2038_03685 [Geminicoccaceae bacterium]|nr:hypothetical protein [Geminicoccaceae bacterium]MCS7268524.1 hypothetical protein [Geminicoccaceae bacterium]MCX7629333.1 hypothetical protein [Geminicoccaceae bacterium]MDW8125574.1 hypothetical protein [Geminicoccaceae bacterium]MDW8340760.1 hypothetical protein [Geminicoccaceae bacterium]
MYPFVLALAVALLMTIARPAPAGWQDDLAAEIRAAHGCSVAYLTQIVERTLDGRQVIFAKVHCEDGRVFDASRTSALEPFAFKECPTGREPQAC